MERNNITGGWPQRLPSLSLTHTCATGTAPAVIDSHCIYIQLQPNTKPGPKVAACGRLKIIMCLTWRIRRCVHPPPPHAAFRLYTSTVYKRVTSYDAASPRHLLLCTCRAKRAASPNVR
jgi:hypothetical protein